MGHAAYAVIDFFALAHDVWLTGWRLLAEQFCDGSAWVSQIIPYGLDLLFACWFASHCWFGWRYSRLLRWLQRFEPRPKIDPGPVTVCKRPDGSWQELITTSKWVDCSDPALRPAAAPQPASAAQEAFTPMSDGVLRRGDAKRKAEASGL